MVYIHYSLEAKPTKSFGIFPKLGEFDDTQQRQIFDGVKGGYDGLVGVMERYITEKQVPAARQTTVDVGAEKKREHGIAPEPAEPQTSRALRLVHLTKLKTTTGYKVGEKGEPIYGKLAYNAPKDSKGGIIDVELHIRDDFADLDERVRINLKQHSERLNATLNRTAVADIFPSIPNI
ncbi:MAG TPA: hypothetical protein VJI97_02935 [Candidatus Nanoarchaeia archaeon]|nr:hypothetical protein [Candidatus Nanoarchaeia archaeon]